MIMEHYDEETISTAHQASWSVAPHAKMGTAVNFCIHSRQISMYRLCNNIDYV